MRFFYLILYSYGFLVIRFFNGLDAFGQLKRMPPYASRLQIIEKYLDRRYYTPSNFSKS